jgi:hypothetical protein
MEWELDILEDKPAQKFDLPIVEPKNACVVRGDNLVAYGGRDCFSLLQNLFLKSLTNQL